jgi:hypothetical protein
MSAQVTISQLPTAGAITGTELVPVVQNGVTVQTTAAALAGSPVQTYTYLTVSQTPQLANSRYVGVTNGLTITDGGAQGLFNISTTGALLSLVNSGTGFQVKTSATAITPRSITVSGTGLSITNGSGVSGDPTISLTGQISNLANASFNGLVVLSTAGAVTSATITGTSNQIVVTNGNGISGNPTVGLADNPVLPGAASATLPIGTTGDRPGSPVNGMLRYNSSIALFEGYINNAWSSLAAGSGVTSIATGTGLTGGPITSTGTISIDSTVVTLTGTQTLTNKSIPASSLTGTVAVANGGTALSATPTNGQLPIGNGTGYSLATLTAGSGISITNTAGGISIATSGGSSGTVTSVSFTGGIISVATATTTPALTVAGTSGGIPYFTSASAWASSAVLAANAIVVGGGAGVTPSTVTTGTGVVTALGVNTGSAGAFVVNGGALGTPSSGTVTNLTGTASININGTVGATTANTGAFTTVTATTGIFGGTF